MAFTLFTSGQNSTHPSRWFRRQVLCEVFSSPLVCHSSLPAPLSPYHDIYSPDFSIRIQWCFCISTPWSRGVNIFGWRYAAIDWWIHASPHPLPQFPQVWNIHRGNVFPGLWFSGGWAGTEVAGSPHAVWGARGQEGGRWRARGGVRARRSRGRAGAERRAQGWAGRSERTRAGAGDGSRCAAGSALGSADPPGRGPGRGRGARGHVLGADQCGARPGARAPAAGTAAALPTRGGGAAAGSDQVRARGWGLSRGDVVRGRGQDTVPRWWGGGRGGRGNS